MFNKYLHNELLSFYDNFLLKELNYFAVTIQLINYKDTLSYFFPSTNTRIYIP